MYACIEVLTILGLVHFCVLLTVLLLCVCVHSVWKGCPRNDLYCVEGDVKPYSLITHWSGLFGRGVG